MPMADPYVDHCALAEKDSDPCHCFVRYLDGDSGTYRTKAWLVKCDVFGRLTQVEH